MQSREWTIGVTLGTCAIVLSACAGTVTSKYAPENTTTAINRPMKDRDCYDAAVVLGVDMQRAQNIARKVLTALDARITTAKVTPTRARTGPNVFVTPSSRTATDTPTLCPKCEAWSKSRVNLVLSWGS